MEASTTEPESPVAAPPRRRGRRWLRIGAGLVALWALADLVLWLLTPSPGTLLLEEPAGSSLVAAGIGVSNGQPILVRFADKDYHQPLRVHRIGDGVALPVAVSPPTWEREPHTYHPWVVTDGRMTVLEPPILYDAETDMQFADGGHDCITEMPLDGGPTVRRCHTPSLRIYAFYAPLITGGSTYYSGTVLKPGYDHDSVALASVSADGTWRELDRVSYGRYESTGSNGIVQDSEAIYWATQRTVRRVSRKDGSARTVFHSDLNPHRMAGLDLVMVGQTLLVAAVQKPSEGGWLPLIYAVDPKGETRTSTAKPIATLDFLAKHLASDGLNAYFVDQNRITRLGPDGQTQVLAQVEDGSQALDLTLTADRVIYLARQYKVGPESLKLWSVPK